MRVMETINGNHPTEHERRGIENVTGGTKIYRKTNTVSDNCFSKF